MEFDININSILRDVITKIDGRLQVCRNADLRFPDSRAQLFKIIDKMGELSARAQGLAGTITTGRKLETSDHHLYIIKDTEGSTGQGAVIGILKIGRKRLFVYDRHGQQWEMNPLCVLDFYVHESRQRMGCGRRLFDFMLKNENMAAQHLAVDRPSHKLSSFLAKHYGLKYEIPQVNNFVIFDGFFTKRPDGDYIQNRRNANLAKPADYPNRGGSEVQSTWQGHGNNYNNNKLYSYPRANASRPNSSRPPSGQRGNNNAVAGLPSILPRHQISRPDNTLKELNLNPRSAQNANTTGNHSPRGLSDLELRSVSAGSSSHRGVNLQLQSTMYSRHQPIPGVDSTLAQPHYTVAHQPPSGNKNNAPSMQRPPSGSKNNVSIMQRPPSGSKNTIARREKSPPMLQRDGPPKDYTDSFNMHQTYQGRAGHLVVPSDPRVLAPPTPATTAVGPMGNSVINTNKPGTDSSRSAYSYRGGYYTQPALHTQADSSWTVSSVLRNQKHFSYRHSGHSRLW